jgi:hypothetical protein
MARPEWEVKARDDAGNVVEEHSCTRQRRALDLMEKARNKGLHPDMTRKPRRERRGRQYVHRAAVRHVA